MSTSRCATYDPFALSEEEKSRFLAALGDGFGYSHRSKRLVEEKLPPDVNLGLLDHRAYYDRFRRSEPYDAEDLGEFWEKSDGDSPPGLFEQCPLSFHLPAIRTYFREQKEAYMSYVKSLRDFGWLSELDPEEQKDWEAELYNQALYKTYSKAWYEYHINEHIYFGDETVAMLHSHAEKGINLGLSILMIVHHSAVLGRLIEQYYWKFLVEKSAIRGAKISESAKTGGAVLASIRKAKHAHWQSAANLIWKKRPAISKMAVASILKKQLDLTQSVKHISRVLNRP
jgi:hypothetical protein